MNRSAWLTAAAILALAALGFFVFPGHTWLQSDTQVYVPILERIYNPAHFANELLAQHPHVQFTIYDETAIAARRLTGIPFRRVLEIEQFAARVAAIAGVYLLAASFGLSSAAALMVAMAFSLGATIIGPAVLSFEYEPVPRCFAVGLLMLALGLLSRGRTMTAAAVGVLAMLYHVPAAYPFWAAWLLSLAWPDRRERARGLLLLAAGFAGLLLYARWQAGDGESQDFFSRIPPAYEALQRMRASYIWVSLWPNGALWHHLFLWAAGLAALWRLWDRVPARVRPLLIGLPLIGILSVPVSWLLLEGWKWSLVPQLQPTRALLFGTVVTVVLAATAGAVAAAAGRLWESVLWFLPVFALPATTLTLGALFDWGSPVMRARALVVAGLAVLSAAALWLCTRRPAAGAVLTGIALLAPFYALPTLGQVRNYPPLHHAELDQLCDWARGGTAEDAVFLFPDAGRALYPGVFRVEAVRALYVDWKAGGQVNFLPRFAEIWWDRWRRTVAPEWRPAAAESYAGLGIDYLVLQARNRLPARAAVFENPRYVVYRLR